MRCSSFQWLKYTPISKKNKKPNILSAGCITTSRDEPIQLRLRCLSEDLNAIKQKYNPTHLSIEKLFFNRKNSTFEKICMAKGIALEIFADLEIEQIEPNKMKSYMTGNGKADKKEIKFVLEKILDRKLDKVLDDTIDAVCLALYHIDLVKFLK